MADNGLISSVMLDYLHQNFTGAGELNPTVGRVN